MARSLARWSWLVVILVTATGCARSRELLTSDAGTATDAPAPIDAARVTVPAGQIAAWTRTDDRDGLTLVIEVWDRAVSDCVPPADVSSDGVLLLAIMGWDRTAGTWRIGEETEHGIAAAARGLGDEPATGTLTLEPFDASPRFVSWDLDALGSGRADLGLCGRFDD